MSAIQHKGIRELEQLTKKYYEESATEFVARTLDLELSNAMVEAFSALLPEKAKVLDAGTGSGRDALALMKKGYEVTAFDCSSAMVRNAEKLLNQPVLELRFQDIEFQEEFDGVWANASLLHVHLLELECCMEKLIKALVPGGVFYFSFKYGEGDGIRSDRYFNFQNESTIHGYLDKFENIELIKMEKSLDTRPGRTDEYWLRTIVKKTR